MAADGEGKYRSSGGSRQNEGGHCYCVGLCLYIAFWLIKFGWLEIFTRFDEIVRKWARLKNRVCEHLF